MSWLLTQDHSSPYRTRAKEKGISNSIAFEIALDRRKFSAKHNKFGRNNSNRNKLHWQPVSCSLEFEPVYKVEKQQCIRTKHASSTFFFPQRQSNVQYYWTAACIGCLLLSRQKYVNYRNKQIVLENGIRAEIFYFCVYILPSVLYVKPFLLTINYLAIYQGDLSNKPQNKSNNVLFSTNETCIGGMRAQCWANPNWC